jgi:hypothetical protein
MKFMICQSPLGEYGFCGDGYVRPISFVSAWCSILPICSTASEGATPLRLTLSTHANPALCVTMLTSVHLFTFSVSRSNPDSIFSIRFRIPLASLATIPTSMGMPPSMVSLRMNYFLNGFTHVRFLFVTFRLGCRTGVDYQYYV